MSRKRPRRSTGHHAGGDHDQPHESSGGAERLQKVLAAAGVGSRRDCEELIREGRVEVDRRIVTELGTRVDPLQHEIRVDGEALKRPKRLYFAVNKPEGVVTTNYDPSGRTRVVDLVPTEERVFAVGRLDRASEGLILVTNDGEFANRLTHPRYGVTKTYLVRIAGNPTPAELARLRRGIHLAECFCKVESLHVKGKHKGSTDMVIVLAEGRNREIRRILARLGHKVVRLKRLAVGRLKLADLPVGAWRRLMPAEINGLLAEAKERKRGEQRPKRPSGASKPTQGERGKSPYRAEQAAMAGPPASSGEDDWEGDDEFLAADDGLVEITDDSHSSGPPLVGDVIDYEEPPRPPRPERRRETGKPKKGGPPFGKQRGRFRATAAGDRGPPQQRGARKNRPPKNRRKGRR